MKPTWCTFHSIYWESRALTRLQFHCNCATANWHTHAAYQVPFVQDLLRMSKQCSKHIEALDSHETAIMSQSTDIILTQYAKCCCGAPPEDEQAMFETCRGPWFPWNCNRVTINWYYTHAIHQVLFVKHLLRMSKQCSKHVQVLDSQ
jgi:hypothetical protein